MSSIAECGSKIGGEGVIAKLKNTINEHWKVLLVICICIVIYFIWKKKLLSTSNNDNSLSSNQTFYHNISVPPPIQIPKQGLNLQNDITFGSYGQHNSPYASKDLPSNVFHAQDEQFKGEYDTEEDENKGSPRYVTHESLSQIPQHPVVNDSNQQDESFVASSVKSGMVDVQSYNVLYDNDYSHI